MMVIIVIILSLIAVGHANLSNLNDNLNLNLRHPAIDYNLHEEVLDAEMCAAQISVLRSNPLLMFQFFDAGLRLPRDITLFNFRDMGNYHQCLGINHNTGEELIEGKYCRINVPLSQNLSLPLQSDSTMFDLNGIDEIIAFDNETLAKVEKYSKRRAGIMNLLGLHDERTSKVIFSIIALLTILSTGYDLTNKFWLINDPKRVHPLLTSFSVYTNRRRLNSFSSAPGMLRCVDGIRVLGMAWVVLAHSFSTELIVANMLEAFNWLDSTSSMWITAGVYTVDTFFCLAGVVLVYTTAGKFTGGQLLKNLPLFYLNRLLRLWPILALAILLQVSYLNRVYDGPDWTAVESQTNFCRSTWWLTLLFVQNFINGNEMCVPHSWYMAIDFHCYALSPLVLYWVLGRSRKSAWIALTASLLAILTAATTFNFIKDFPSTITSDGLENEYYQKYYYVNTLTRASPFFVGMIAGYVLHLYRGKKLGIAWMTATSLWVISATVSTTVFFYPAIVANVESVQPFVHNFMNSFMRPAWGAAICWMIVACEHGYGGPVNWFLTLDIWRLPARLAYAVYILHYPMMFVINGALTLAPIYFSVPAFTFKALAHISFSLVVSYLATLIIDAPCSTLSKLLLGGGKKRPGQANKDKQAETGVKDTDR